MGVSQQANSLFKLTPDDWSRPFQELEPSKLVGPQTLMAYSYRGQEPMTLKNIEWSDAKTTKYFDIAIALVYSPHPQKKLLAIKLLAITLTFFDKTSHQHLAKELKSTNMELKRVSEACQPAYIKLEAAYQELELLTQGTPES